MSRAILTLQRADEDTIFYAKILLDKKIGLPSWNVGAKPDHLSVEYDADDRIESVVGVSKSTVQRAAPIGCH